MDDRLDRYEECALCGERFHDDAILGYLHERTNGDYVCRHPCRGAEAPR